MDIVFLPPTFSPRPRRFGRACMVGVSVGIAFWVVATLLMAVFTVANAQTVTLAPVTPGQPLWVAALQPVISALVLALAGILAVVISGLGKKASAWLTAHGDAATAQATASASTIIQAALQTGASTIAGKIATGQLDYTNRAAWQAEAEREVALVEQRVPGAIARAAPVAGALVASLMAKVDAMQVSATPIVAPPAPVSIAQAAAVINDTKAALASLEKAA